jgi:hypothetical protein
MKDTIEFRLALAEGLYALEKKRSDLFAIYEIQKRKTDFFFRLLYAGSAILAMLILMPYFPFSGLFLFGLLFVGIYFAHQSFLKTLFEKANAQYNLIAKPMIINAFATLTPFPASFEASLSDAQNNVLSYFFATWITELQLNKYRRYERTLDSDNLTAANSVGWRFWLGNATAIANVGDNYNYELPYHLTYVLVQAPADKSLNQAKFEQYKQTQLDLDECFVYANSKNQICIFQNFLKAPNPYEVNFRDSFRDNAVIQRLQNSFYNQLKRTEQIIDLYDNLPEITL